MSNTYGYSIDLDERGIFKASVRAANQNTLWEIENEEDGSLALIEDGYMSDTEDVAGLADYLQGVNIITDHETVLPLIEAEEVWERES